jgi:hypothetical protein
MGFNSVFKGLNSLNFGRGEINLFRGPNYSIVFHRGCFIVKNGPRS